MSLERGFHRSQSETPPPTEQAYRRAARELRDFHRARSLDVILEEDGNHHASGSGGMDSSLGGGMSGPLAFGMSSGALKKKRACLCLADLVDDASQERDGSETNEEDEEVQDATQQHSFVVEQEEDAGQHHHQHHHLHSWGHFGDMEGDDHDLRHAGRAASGRIRSLHHDHPGGRQKARTFGRFGQS